MKERDVENSFYNHKATGYVSQSPQAKLNQLENFVARQSKNFNIYSHSVEKAKKIFDELQTKKNTLSQEEENLKRLSSENLEKKELTKSESRERSKINQNIRALNKTITKLEAQFKDAYSIVEKNYLDVKDFVVINQDYIKNNLQLAEVALKAVENGENDQTINHLIKSREKEANAKIVEANQALKGLLIANLSISRPEINLLQAFKYHRNYHQDIGSGQKPTKLYTNLLDRFKINIARYKTESEPAANKPNQETQPNRPRVNTNNFNDFIIQHSNLTNFKNYTRLVDKATVAIDRLKELRETQQGSLKGEPGKAYYETLKKIKKTEEEAIRFAGMAEVEAKRIDKALEDAHLYADFGQKMIDISMTAKDEKDFKEQMNALEKEINDKFYPNIDVKDNPHSRVNVMVCYKYAQDRDNFNAGHGYGKGSNINQYGPDIESANPPADRIWSYFTEQVEKKECGYERISTHDFSKRQIKKLNKEGINLKAPEVSQHYGMDADFEKFDTVIPLPTAGTHHILIVRGKEPYEAKNQEQPDSEDSIPLLQGSKSEAPQFITKLLVKGEDWGMKTADHKFLHGVDYILTRPWFEKIKSSLLSLCSVFSEKTKEIVYSILEGRQETKQLIESSVVNAVNTLKRSEQFADSKSADSDRLLKSAFIIKKLEKIADQKGFEKPLALLSELKTELEKIKITEDRAHPLKNFMSQIDSTILELEEAKQKKYSSQNVGSEVRPIYVYDKATGHYAALYSQENQQAHQTSVPDAPPVLEEPTAEESHEVTDKNSVAAVESAISDPAEIMNRFKKGVLHERPGSNTNEENDSDPDLDSTQESGSNYSR